MSAVSDGTTESPSGLHMSPDAEIRTVRSRDIVLIEFVAGPSQAPLLLDSGLAAMILHLAAESLPKRKLSKKLGLSTISWSAVCILAHLQLGAAMAVRAVEQAQVISTAEAQSILLSFIAAIAGAPATSLDPYRLGQALSTCVVYLGDSAGDIHHVAEPLRRAPEVCGLVAAT